MSITIAKNKKLLQKANTSTKPLILQKTPILDRIRLTSKKKTN